MEWISPQDSQSVFNLASAKLQEVIYTKEFIDQPDENIDKLVVSACWLQNYEEAANKLLEILANRQTDLKIMRYAIQMCYLANKFSQTFMLMRNYIELENDYEVFKIGIDLCINKLDLQELAITIADRGLLAFLNDQYFNYGKGIAFAILGDKAVYQEQREKNWNEAILLLQNNLTSHRKNSLYQALLLAQLGRIQEAKEIGIQGFRQTHDVEYYALLCLFSLHDQNYTQAHKVLSSGFLQYPKNQLLLCMKVITSMQLFKHTKDGQQVQDSILHLLNLTRDDDTPKSAKEQGLRIIKEEPSNLADSIDDFEQITQAMIDMKSYQQIQISKLAFQALILIGNYKQAEILLRKLPNKDFEQAQLDYYTKGQIESLVLLYDNAKAQQLLSIAYYDNQQYDQALSAAKNAVWMDTRCSQSWTIIGKIQQDSGLDPSDAYINAISVPDTPFEVITKML